MYVVCCPACVSFTYKGPHLKMYSCVEVPIFIELHERELKHCLDKVVHVFESDSFGSAVHLLHGVGVLLNYLHCFFYAVIHHCVTRHSCIYHSWVLHYSGLCCLQIFYSAAAGWLVFVCQVRKFRFSVLLLCCLLHCLSLLFLLLIVVTVALWFACQDDYCCAYCGNCQNSYVACM